MSISKWGSERLGSEWVVQPVSGAGITCSEAASGWDSNWMGQQGGECGRDEWVGEAANNK